MMRRRSIRQRVTIGFAVSIGILMIAFSFGLIHHFRQLDERLADETVLKAIDRFFHEYAELDDKGDVAEAADEIRERYRYDGTDVAVFGLDWRLISGTPGGIARWPDDGVADWWGKSTLVDKRYNVVIGVPWRKAERKLGIEEMILLAMSLFLTGLGALAAWELVGRTLSPIARLSNQARTASTDDLTVRLKPPSDDVEIVGLVETLNGLLSRAAETTASKGHFYSAASHELRTPLQALSGHLELALTRPRSAEEYKASIEEASVQARRLTDLVQDLLRLYRLDHAESVPKSVVHDLSAACRDSISEYQPLIKERNLHVSCALPDSVPICSPRTQIGVLIRNLIENAMNYADSGSEVSITVQVTDNQAVLEIFNKCSPSPDWDANRLFEPFARLDSSRSSHTGGTGLGLAICRAIAVANQWDLCLEQADGGVRASVDIPVLTGTADCDSIGQPESGAED